MFNNKYFISVLLVFLSPLSAYAAQDLSENFIDKSNKIEDPQSEEEKDSNLDPPRKTTYEVTKEELKAVEDRVMEKYSILERRC